MVTQLNVYSTFPGAIHFISESAVLRGEWAANIVSLSLVNLTLFRILHRTPMRTLCDLMSSPFLSGAAKCSSSTTQS